MERSQKVAIAIRRWFCHLNRIQHLRQLYKLCVTAISVSLALSRKSQSTPSCAWSCVCVFLLLLLLQKFPILFVQANRRNTLLVLEKRYKKIQTMMTTRRRRRQQKTIVESREIVSLYLLDQIFRLMSKLINWHMQISK